MRTFGIEQNHFTLVGYRRRSARVSGAGDYSTVLPFHLLVGLGLVRSRCQLFHPEYRT